MHIKLYKTKKGILIEDERSFFLAENLDWDEFINDDRLLDKVTRNYSNRCSGSQRQGFDFRLYRSAY
jgi:hypothetical protein